MGKSYFQSVSDKKGTKYYKETKRMFIFPKTRFEKGYKKYYKR